MKSVLITGGIGSGKSHICRLFEKYGVPVLNFDGEAKTVMHDSVVVYKMRKLFGDDIYKNSTLDTSKLGKIIFNDDSKRVQIENLIKPELMKIFYNECYKYEYEDPRPLFLAESASIIKKDSHTFKNIFDRIIIIDAKLEKRKEMVMTYRHMSEEDFMLRVSKQPDINEIENILIRSGAKYTVFENHYTDERAEKFVLDYINYNI